MGGPGSGRWHRHQKAALIEERPSVDLVALRRAGLLEGPDAVHPEELLAGFDWQRVGTADRVLEWDGSRVRGALRSDA